MATAEDNDLPTLPLGPLGEGWGESWLTISTRSSPRRSPAGVGRGR